MFERFTDRARRVVVLAQEEAQALHHPQVGTEHLLLALLREKEGVGAQALAALGITEAQVRTELGDRATPGNAPVPPGSHIPFSRPAKQTLEQALRAALELGHNYLGTEHVLLGLARVPEGSAAEVLGRLGADVDTLKGQVALALTDVPEATHRRWWRRRSS